MKPPGILVSCFDFSPVAEDEFHDWYDTEHIPERERVPGFLRCRRWLGPDGSKVAAATYDLESIDVLRSPGYLAIGYENNSPWTRRVGWRCVSLLRFEGELAAGREAPGGGEAGALLICAMNVEPAFDGELVDGFRGEHALRAATVPGVRDVRLFRATASKRTHVVLYRLDAPGTVDSSGWKSIAEEPWAQRMLSPGHDSLRILCRRYVRAPASNAKEAA
jgi:hypothetical protein